MSMVGIIVIIVPIQKSFNSLFKWLYTCVNLYVCVYVWI